MTFLEFVEAATVPLQARGARIIRKHESNAGWSVSFSRAAFVFRVRPDAHASALLLEQEQGSFIPNSPSAWRVRESCEMADGEFETALVALDGLLARFAVT